MIYGAARSIPVIYLPRARRLHARIFLRRLCTRWFRRGSPTAVHGTHGCFLYSWFGYRSCLPFAFTLPCHRLVCTRAHTVRALHSISPRTLLVLAYTAGDVSAFVLTTRVLPRLLQRTARAHATIRRTNNVAVTRYGLPTLTLRRITLHVLRSSACLYTCGLRIAVRLHRALLFAFVVTRYLPAFTPDYRPT